MIVGNPAVFAIESEISKMYERLSYRALGFFVIHVGGLRYGVYDPEATMLANSFDEVGRRLAERGMHTCGFGAEPEAAKIAVAVSCAVYSDAPGEEQVFGIAPSEFQRQLSAKDLLWAPDGDEAFDDGSHVLQLDVEDRVRLIAFKRIGGDCPDLGTLREVWMAGGEFYGVLQKWHDDFKAAWSAALGTSLLN
jgi:hypothetical protein